jgi:hypothetical protein
MKLITEQYLAEAKKEGNSYFIEGIFMQSDVKNRNGRIYPTSIMDNEVNRYIKEYVDRGRAVGELNHPQSPSINLDRVCHKVTGMTKDGNNWIGRAKILNTPMGKVVEGLLEGGVQIGVSSRGLGSLKSVHGIQEVQNDFRLAAIDIVSDPSAPDAYVEAVMEDVSWTYCEDGQCYIRQDLVEEHKKEIKCKKVDAQRKIKMFEEFILNIKG